MTAGAVAETLVTATISFAEQYAEQKGAAALGAVFTSAGVLFDGHKVFFEKNTVAAAAGFVAGVVVCGLLLPEELAAAGGALAVTGPMVSVAALLVPAFGSAIARTAVSAASVAIVSYLEAHGIEEGVKDLLTATGIVSDDIYANAGSRGLGLAGVNNSDGTSSWTGSLPDGSTVNTEFAGPNASGRATSQSIEYSDGTSDVTTFATDGSSVTTSYSGPGGSGSITSIDTENSDGTSAITTVISDGASVTQEYSGTHGSGSVGQSSASLHYDTVDQDTGDPVTYSAGIVFDQTNFVLPSTRAFVASPTTTFGTTAHFVGGNLNPYGENKVYIYEGLAQGGGGLFVAPTQSDAQVTFSTSLVNLGNTAGIYNNVSISVGQGVSYNGAVSAPINLTISGKVYAAAHATFSDPAVASHYFHVGDGATIQVQVTNDAQGALADRLGIALAPGGAAGILTSLAAVGYLAQGQTATMTLGLDTSQGGYYQLGADNFTLTSHDADLADIAAPSAGSIKSAYIYEYAKPMLVDASTGSGAGNFFQNGNHYTLDFGNLKYSTSQNSSAAALIQIFDGFVSGYIDSLKGTLTASGSGFLDQYTFDISGQLATPGGYFTLGYFRPDVSTLGAHSETIVFHPIGVNVSGYSGALPDVTLTIVDNVVSAPTFTVGNDVVGLTSKGQTWHALTGDDSVVGTFGDDTIFGDAGDDSIQGSSGSDALYGGGGVDTLSYAGSSSGVVLNLAKRTASGGDAAGDNIAGFENVLGSSFGDFLVGGAGANRIEGGGGNDTIIGGGGHDRLIGGLGADVFLFSSILDSAIGNARDLISDFHHSQGDRINLSKIDATASTAANDPFVFTSGQGAGDFTHVEGQLRYYHTPTSTIVQMDVNGDGVADSEIGLTGVLTLTQSDFIL